MRLTHCSVVAAVALVALIGCTKETKVNDAKNNASDDEMFERYLGKKLSEFKNRKIYKELNREIIKFIPDDDLTQAIHDFIGLKINQDWEQDTELVPRLGPGFSAVYFLSLLDAEVNNGGFYQFFYNCGRDSVVRAKEGADLLGLGGLSSVISEALRIEESEREKIGRVKAEGSLEAFFESYKDISFETADEAFMALNLDLYQERVRFIRKCSELFEGRVNE
jgi:hypothetical protein